MRQLLSGAIAALALVAIGSAPAMACGASPCAPGYYGGYGYSVYYGGYAHLPELSTPPGAPQYYWVNQGPTYSGPGMFAPVPTYQERAVSGWGAYDRDYYYGYYGGPYGNATSHYYDGAPAWHGPAIYTYRWHHHRRGHWRHHARPSIRYGYAPRYRYRSAYRHAAPRMIGVRHHSHRGYHHHRHH